MAAANPALAATPAAVLSPFQAALKDAALVALVAMALAGPIVGLQTLDAGGQLTVNLRFTEVALGIVIVFFGRLGLALGERKLIIPSLGVGVALVVAGFLVPWPAGLLKVLRSPPASPLSSGAASATGATGAPRPRSRSP